MTVYTKRYIDRLKAEKKCIRCRKPTDVTGAAIVDGKPAAGRQRCEECSKKHRATEAKRYQSRVKAKAA